MPYNKQKRRQIWETSTTKIDNMLWQTKEGKVAQFTFLHFCIFIFLDLGTFFCFLTLLSTCLKMRFIFYLRIGTCLHAAILYYVWHDNGQPAVNFLTGTNNKNNVCNSAENHKKYWKQHISSRENRRFRWMARSQIVTVQDQASLTNDDQVPKQQIATQDSND